MYSVQDIAEDDSHFKKDNQTETGLNFDLPSIPLFCP